MLVCMMGEFPGDPANRITEQLINQTKTTEQIMHEMGIAMEILKIVQASIPADMAEARVRRVNLKVGKLSTIVPDSLRFCFGVVADKTNVAQAELAIEEVPVQARCTSCNHEWTIDSSVFVCPACGSGKTDLLTGRELDIVSIEIDE